MNEKNKIFSPGEHLSEEKLIAYLGGKLSPAEQHDVEHWLSDEGLESDALEGLNRLKPKQVKNSIKSLNSKLQKNIAGKRQSRRHLKTDQFTWIAIVIILMLIVLAYIVIRKSI